MENKASRSPTGTLISTAHKLQKAAAWNLLKVPSCGPSLRLAGTRSLGGAGPVFLLEKVNSAASRPLGVALSQPRAQALWALRVLWPAQLALVQPDHGEPLPFLCRPCDRQGRAAHPSLLAWASALVWSRGTGHRLAPAAAPTLEPLFVGADPAGVLEGILRLLPPGGSPLVSGGTLLPCMRGLQQSPSTREREPIQIICCFLYVFCCELPRWAYKLVPQPGHCPAVAGR